MIFLQIRELHDTEWQRDKIWPQSYTCGGRKNGNFNVYLTHGMSTDYGSVQLGIKFMHDMISVQKINLLQFLLQLTYKTKTTCHLSFRALFCLTVLVVLHSFGGFHLIHIEHRRTELMCHELCRHGPLANSKHQQSSVQKASLQTSAALPVFAGGWHLSSILRC